MMLMHYFMFRNICSCIIRRHQDIVWKLLLANIVNFMKLSLKGNSHSIEREPRNSSFEVAFEVGPYHKSYSAFSAAAEQS